MVGAKYWIGIFALCVLSSQVNAKPHPHQGLLKPYRGAPPAIKLTTQDRADLAAGKSVMKQVEGKDGGRGMAVQDIEAPTDKVWSRILDYPAYPRMVKDVKETETYETKGNHIKTRFVIGGMGLSYEYFIDHIIEKEKGYMTWTLDYSRESELDDSVGYWFVEAHPEKKGWTRLYYSVDIKLKGWMPKFMQNIVRDEGLKRATQWVKREAEKK
jgi:hypothetical protein